MSHETSNKKSALIHPSEILLEEFLNSTGLSQYRLAATHYDLERLTMESCAAISSEVVALNP